MLKQITFLLLSTILINHAIAASFPTPVAGTYYPLYNNEIGQYVEPTLDMPFDKVSVLFIAFAHAYPHGKGAILQLDNAQPDELKRLPLLMKIAHQVNTPIKCLITLGFDKNDWGYINNDYVNQAHQFIPSVISFLRTYHLDGLDIDDENINAYGGFISQKNFDGVIKQLKDALDKAGKRDNKNYYLTIMPGYGQSNLDENNIHHFDLINTQNYSGSYPSQFIALGYPRQQIVQGLHTHYECDSALPTATGFAGIFNWNMTEDIFCQYYYTNKIAEVLKYPLYHCPIQKAEGICKKGLWQVKILSEKNWTRYSPELSGTNCVREGEKANLVNWQYAAQHNNSAPIYCSYLLMDNEKYEIGEINIASNSNHTRIGNNWKPGDFPFDWECYAGRKACQFK